ncbi:helix-turn-helix domain-containing protein, partial [Dysosmobacter welbionis]
QGLVGLLQSLLSSGVIVQHFLQGFHLMYHPLSGSCPAQILLTLWAASLRTKPIYAVRAVSAARMASSTSP